MLVAALAIGRDALASARYAVAWSSHRTLWERLVEVSPTEPRGYQLLGIDARERGDTARALPLLARAFAMEPRARRNRFEYGQVLYATGRHAQAAQVLAPLLANGDVRREPQFVAMYLDAVGRAHGAEAVVTEGVAAAPLGVRVDRRRCTSAPPTSSSDDSPRPTPCTASGCARRRTTRSSSRGARPWSGGSAPR